MIVTLESQIELFENRLHASIGEYYYLTTVSSAVNLQAVHESVYSSLKQRYHTTHTQPCTNRQT